MPLILLRIEPLGLPMINVPLALLLQIQMAKTLVYSFRHANIMCLPYLNCEYFSIVFTNHLAHTNHTGFGETYRDNAMPWQMLIVELVCSAHIQTECGDNQV